MRETFDTGWEINISASLWTEKVIRQLAQSLGYYRVTLVTNPWNEPGIGQRAEYIPKSKTRNRNFRNYSGGIISDSIRVYHRT